MVFWLSRSLPFAECSIQTKCNRTVITVALQLFCKNLCRIKQGKGSLDSFSGLLVVRFGGDNNDNIKDSFRIWFTLCDFPEQSDFIRKILTVTYTGDFIDVVCYTNLLHFGFTLNNQKCLFITQVWMRPYHHFLNRMALRQSKHKTHV